MLDPDSIRVDTETSRVRLDDEPNETDRTCLRIAGTPDGFRWLAKLLTELATNADAHPFDQVIVSGRKLEAVTLGSWDAIHLECERHDPRLTDGG